MDCVRVSRWEAKGEKYMGNYREEHQVANLGANACRQACITSLSCKAWEYNAEQGKCMLTDQLRMDHPRLEQSHPESHSGLVECEKVWSMLSLIGWIFFLGLILTAVWFALNICGRRGKS